MNKCKHCQKDTINPSFCNHSCAASYNNKGKHRWGRNPSDWLTCIICGNRASRGAGKYCGSICAGKHKSKTTFQKNKEMFFAGKRTHRRWIYEILKERDGNKCSECGITEWRNKPLRFWVDHIDGDASNDKPENFRLVCLNCDSQSPTFGGKNLGNGRKSRGMKQYG